MDAAPPQLSKAAKIWRRTRVGGTLALALTLVLWTVSRFDSGLPLLAACAAILAATLYEVDRMGSFAGRRLGLVLSPPALVLLAITAQLLAAPRSEDFGPFVGALWFSNCAVAVGAFAFASFALFRGWSWPMRLAALVLALALLWSMLQPAGELFPVQSMLALIAFLFLLVLLGFHAPRALRLDLLIALGLALWIVLPIPGLALAWHAFGFRGLLALIVLAKIGDNAAYYVGSTLGRHHPFKRLSPGKTSEGCVASLAAGVAAGAACVACGLLPAEPLGLLGGCGAGALVNLAAQSGDLLESWVKRRAGVKDSGPWFGPSGGVLDLIDSFLLGVPAALYGWPLLFTFPGAA